MLKGIWIIFSFENKNSDDLSEASMLKINTHSAPHPHPTVIPLPANSHISYLIYSWTSVIKRINCSVLKRSFLFGHHGLIQEDTWSQASPMSAFLGILDWNRRRVYVSKLLESCKSRCYWHPFPSGQEKKLEISADEEKNEADDQRGTTIRL